MHVCTSETRRSLTVPAVCYLLAVTWCGHILLAGLLTAFRAIKTSGIAGAFQFDDVPLLRFFDTRYGFFYDGLLISGGILAVVLMAGCWWRLKLGSPRRPDWLSGLSEAQRTALLWMGALLLFEGCLLWTTRPVNTADAAVSTVNPVSASDWGAVVLLMGVMWWTPLILSGVLSAGQRSIPERKGGLPRQGDVFFRSSRLIRNGAFFLLGTVGVLLYAWVDHRKFWNPEGNGGYNYRPFFRPEELSVIEWGPGSFNQVDLVLYSTSLLFAALAVMGGCFGIALFRWAAVRSFYRLRGISKSSRRSSPEKQSHMAEHLQPLPHSRELSLISALIWSVILMVPWQIKIWPEISAERGWIFPVVSLVYLSAALLPMMELSLRLLFSGGRSSLSAEDDVCREPHPAGSFLQPRPSEVALWNFVLFAVYPLLSFLRQLLLRAVSRPFSVRDSVHNEAGDNERAGKERAREKEGRDKENDKEKSDSTKPVLPTEDGRADAAGRKLPGLPVWTVLAGHLWLFLLSGAAIGGMTWSAYKANSLYKFDDWRGMLRSGLFPFLRVAFALLSAAFVYLAVRRILLLIGYVLGRWCRPGTTLQGKGVLRCLQGGMVLSSGALLAAATWPFWGWHNIPHNVFARTVEYSHRHEFELRFLHWLFDCDRDGYAAVLHGADPDDFDASVQAGDLPPPRYDHAIPFDEFRIADPVRAREFPNVMILFLEGVTRESISIFGHRRVKGTPHIDSLVEEGGAAFTQARCFYPSTWDAWFSTLSGRYFRIQEMDTSRGFGNRYCRYSNLYKILQLAGIDRYCHADTEPFYEMLVPYHLRNNPKTAWMPDFDSNVSAEEEERGVWRGDKRNDRMLQFLDDLKPGERFFLCEHMSDSHFPWNRVPGYEWAGEDAVLPGGWSDLHYTHYFQTIARVDAQIGQLLQKLKDKGLYENTLIIIVSDHGCQWWEHEHMYYVSHLYDQSLLVPLIVKVPRLHVPPARRLIEEPVLQIDLLPTLMELAGIVLDNPRNDFPLPGHSLLPLMRGTATAGQKRRFRERDVPLTTHYDKLGVIHHFRYKLIFNRPVGTCKLFDLVEDPAEMRNLVDDRPDLLQEMLGRLREQIRRHPIVIGGFQRDGKTP